MPVRAIRGAITVDGDEAGEITRRTMELLAVVFDRNGVEEEDVISVFFTATKDLKSLAPAAAAREFGLVDVPLLCAQEVDIEKSIDKCVRLMLHVETDKLRKDLVHVFLRGASELRPDLSLDSHDDGSIELIESDI